MRRGVAFLHVGVANLPEGGKGVAAVIRRAARVIATGRTVRGRKVHLRAFGPDGPVPAFRHVADSRQSEPATGRGRG